MQLNNKEVEALSKIVDYMYEDEKRHFEEGEQEEAHIFRHLILLKRKLHNRYITRY